MHKFVINDFEGPLDLLLHLVHQADIDIYDINLEEITNQYLTFINEMEKLELNIASEYIVMAAELIELKSRSLLPHFEEVNEDGIEVDPREELINRILEYKRYKEITSEFKNLEEKRHDCFSKEPSSLKEYVVETTEKSDISILLNAFNEFMQKKSKENIVTKTTVKEYSVSDRSKEIRVLLKKKKKIEFTELFTTITREYIVVTFLALLEMAKNDEINILQSSNFDKIYIVGGQNESSN